MSRFSIALALVASLTTSAFAGLDARGDFARPPAAADVSTPPTGHGIMRPQRVLDRATVRAKLLERRAENLARFRAYQAKGVFPSNTYRGRKLNVWIDEDGNLCAAATIINASGQDELVTRTGEQTNFIRLGDVKQGPLMDWILTSGLTQEEIAAIQAPFVYVGDGMDRFGLVPAPVDPQLRTNENARLAKIYKQVERRIVKDRKQSIELAVTRLMKHSDLAWQLLDS